MLWMLANKLDELQSLLIGVFYQSQHWISIQCLIGTVLAGPVLR